MGLRGILALSLMLWVFPLGLRSQSSVAGLGCSFQGLHLDKCLNQEGEYLFLEPCCRAVNQALRDGFHCLCSVIALAANAPQFDNLFSWSLSSCYIAVPPLTMCQATMPISLPIPLGSPPKEMNTQPSIQENILIPPPPPMPQPIDVALTSASKGNSTSVSEMEQVSNKKVTPSLHVLKNGKNVSSAGDPKSKNVSSGDDSTDALCCQAWLLSLAVYSLVLAA